jgi:hypothetical protein
VLGAAPGETVNFDHLEKDGFWPPLFARRSELARESPRAFAGKPAPTANLFALLL